MEKGFSITDEGSLVDAKAAKAAGYNLAYIRTLKVRESGGQKDDANITGNRDAFLAAGISCGTFMDFDWRAGVKAADLAGAYAAHWRAEDLLPPAIRLWDIKGAAIADWFAFTMLLADTAYYIDQKVHRKPVIMANASQISTITQTLAKLTSENQEKITSCWWCAISWMANPPVLPLPFTRYPFWISSNHINMIPGALNVAFTWWPGSLAQLSTWAKNPTMDNLPAWGAVEPEEPPEDPEDPGDPEIPPASEEKTLSDVYALLEKLYTHIGGK